MHCHLFFSLSFPVPLIPPSFMLALVRSCTSEPVFLPCEDLHMQTVGQMPCRGNYLHFSLKIAEKQMYLCYCRHLSCFAQVCFKIESVWAV